MNKQKTFNTVRDHLLAQGRRSKRRARKSDPAPGSSICLYRSPAGLSCAIGCLIPDDVYDPSIEGDPVYCLPPKIRKALGIRTDEDEELLFSLQNVHDNHDPRTWKNELTWVAEQYGLKP